MLPTRSGDRWDWIMPPTCQRHTSLSCRLCQREGGAGFLEADPVTGYARWVVRYLAKIANGPSRPSKRTGEPSVLICVAASLSSTTSSVFGLAGAVSILDDAPAR